MYLVFIGDMDNLGAPDFEHRFVPRIKVRRPIRIVGN